MNALHRLRFWILPACLVLGVFAVGIDQAIKMLVHIHVPQVGLFPGSLLNIQHLENPGIAFGIPVPGIVFASVFLVILFGVVVRYRSVTRQYPFLFTFLLAGAISNILDRYLHGVVIDYVSIWILPVFNLADVFIIVSILVFLLKYYRKSSLDTSE